MAAELNEWLKVICKAGVAYRTAISNAVHEDDDRWPSAGENDLAERNITFWIVQEIRRHQPELEPIFEFSLSNCGASGRIDCLLHANQSVVLIESKLLYHNRQQASSLAADISRMRECAGNIAMRFQAATCIGIATGSMWMNSGDERELMVEARESVLRWFQGKDHKALQQFPQLTEQILEIESHNSGVRFAKRACTWKSEQQWLLGVAWRADFDAGQSGRNVVRAEERPIGFGPSIRP